MNGLRESPFLEEDPILVLEKPFDLERTARERLRSTPYSALRAVACEVQEGILVLMGCLPSFFLKQMAQEKVAEVAGACGIDNRIHVPEPGPSGSN